MIPFNFEEIKDFFGPPASRTLKRRLIKLGFNQQLSIYGVLTDDESKESEYRRIEVLSNIRYDQRIVTLIYSMFLDLKPPGKYTIWIYDKERDSIKQAGRFN